MRLKYAVVFEQTPNNYGAYVPDLPGCIGTGASWREIQDNIREAIEFPDPRMSICDAMTFHSETLSEHGGTAPQLETTVAMVEVEVTQSRAAGVR